MNLLVRFGIGCLAGAAATAIMDPATEILYSEEIARREREIQPESTSQRLASRLLNALDLEPSQADIDKIAPLLHWTFGIACGGVAGVLSRNAFAGGMTVAAAMLAFDEFGLPLLGAAQPPGEYPWQTHVRGAFGHLVYGLTCATGLSLLAALIGSGRRG